MFRYLVVIVTKFVIILDICKYYSRKIFALVILKVMSLPL